MAHKLAALFIIFAAMFGLAFAQENTPFHISNCPTATNCCNVPAPMMTEPIPGGRPTVVPQAAVNFFGAHVSNQNAAPEYLQFFNANAVPASGATPIGASSWFIPGTQDRDLDTGALRGMAFTVGIEACCSSTQGTYTPVTGCGFLLEYY